MFGSSQYRLALVALLIAASGSLFANDIAVAAPNGKSGWLLLENPHGETGPGLSDFAGDPGMPAPDPLNWPHGAAADGTYPQTDLWRFEDGRYTRATNVLSADTRESFKRTLYSVFMIGEQPYVLHYDPHLSLKQGCTQVLRVDDKTANAAGTPPAESIVFSSADFIDAPAASLDGKRVVFRAFKLVGGKYQISLRVFTTADWKLESESGARTFARPVWISNRALAVIAYDAATLPEAPQRDTSLKFSLRTLESHTPQPGTLFRVVMLLGRLWSLPVLAGSFPPDRYTRTLVADPKGLGLVVARAETRKVDGKDVTEIVAEQREPRAGGATRKIGVYALWRGCSVSEDKVRCAGVSEIDRANTFVLRLIDRAVEPEIYELDMPQISPEGHGGLIDLGHGVFGVVEAVMNPGYEPPKPGEADSAQLLRHTLRVFGWPGCDTMRNPRVLQKLSTLVRRFEELGTVKSTLLAFDVEISANNGRNEKKGRYVELYSAKGRKGNGAIRIEDSLSGSWLVQSIDGGGDPSTDKYYSWAGVDPKNPPQMDSKPAADAGKAYDDLITQLEARRLLMLNGAEMDWQNGGLTFLKRDSYHDPNNGATRRVWVFEKYGRVLDQEKYKTAEAELKQLEAAPEGATDEEREAAWQARRAKIRELKNLRERIEIRFVADLPIGSAGDWKFPHAIAQVQMRFALSNGQKAAYTELSFEPDKYVSLPNLVDLANPGDKPKPDLLLPKVFCIYGRNKDGKLVPELKATAVDKQFDHPAALATRGKLTPGYEVPGAAQNNKQFTDLKR